jgi:hypothetical protein
MEKMYGIATRPGFTEGAGLEPAPTDDLNGIKIFFII